jgi:hypothetical protein
MKTLGKRLTYFIESQGLGKHEFCIKNGLNYDSILPISTDKRALGINILNQLIALYPSLSADWLLYGKGSISIDNSAMDYVNETTENYVPDVVEKVFLTYLNKQNVRNDLKKTVEQVIKQEKIENKVKTEPDEFVLKLIITEENSELVARLEELIKGDIASQRLPSKK